MNSPLLLGWRLSSNYGSLAATIAARPSSTKDASSINYHRECYSFHLVSSTSFSAQDSSSQSQITDYRTLRGRNARLSTVSPHPTTKSASWAQTSSMLELSPTLRRAALGQPSCPSRFSPSEWSNDWLTSPPWENRSGLLRLARI